MKIIAGLNKGRYLKVARSGMRPTKGIVRSAIFNVLGKKVNDAWIMDIFAGTGALGIEALSRGAKFCTFIENHPKMLIKNIKELGLTAKTEIIKKDFRPALKQLHKKKFDIIFIDPPYEKDYLIPAMKLLHLYSLIAKNGIVVAEHTHFNPCVFPSEYILLKEKRYGDTFVSFLTSKGDDKE
ncbi:MAG: 16S rRNA (guanine(966)-N(2))-methyltransferase RsmD [bacterium]